METSQLKMETKTEQKIRLVDGEFTPGEARDVINALIDEKLNFHKLNRLSLCEGNNNSDTSYDCGRIDELKRERELTTDFIKLALDRGAMLKIKGTLEVEMVW